jgi:hypothetical protein
MSWLVFRGLSIVPVLVLLSIVPELLPESFIVPERSLLVAPLWLPVVLPEL